MATFTTCDKCHRPISLGVYEVRVEKKQSRPESPSAPVRRLADVCDDCVKNILEPYPEGPVHRGP
jgi:hypothetical protein